MITEGLSAHVTSVQKGKQITVKDNQKIDFAEIKTNLFVER